MGRLACRSLRRSPALASGLLLAALSLCCGTPAGANSQAYVGEVITTGGNFCPLGFLEANGRLLPIAEYETLFQLIGTKFGGDGVSTFALPMIPPTFTAPGAPVLHCIAWAGIFPSRN